MQIRTITVGAREADVGRAAAAVQQARVRLEAAGYEVQMLRLALPRLPYMRIGLVEYAQQIERQAADAGFECVSLGPIDATRMPALPDALAATGSVFASAAITRLDGEDYAEATSAVAETIVAIGAATPGGFGNMRFAALAGVAPGSPFFPAAYHDGGVPSIAVGPEAAALAIQAIADCGLRQSALSNLQAAIETHDARIGAALAGLEGTTGVRFGGCDWSLAPHPEEGRGIGAAIEALSGVPFGAWGTLAAVHSLTAAVRTARVTRLGFSGVMLPVLEDATLARRNVEGRYTLRDLLAFSAVCGTGLDTIPLPGDTTPEQIAGVLAEVAALSTALRKPLTARLLPLPGLRAGEMTQFDDLYFVNTRVMRI